MTKLAANLSWLFTEVDFPERFKAAALAGFKGIECLFPYDFEASEVYSLLNDNNLQAVLINAPPGEWAAGERGLACLAGRQQEFRDSVKQSIDYAKAINCQKIHIMAGIGDASARGLYVENLHYAADACAAAGLHGLIEPINNMDMPGYFLSRPDQGIEILNAVAHPALALQLDIYHVAKVGFDPLQTIELNIDAIAHFQIAGLVGRHEPDDGQIDITALFDTIDSLGYEGWIGCEYRPRKTTLNGLDWAARYLSVNKQTH